MVTPGPTKTSAVTQASASIEIERQAQQRQADDLVVVAGTAQEAILTDDGAATQGDPFDAVAIDVVAEAAFIFHGELPRCPDAGRGIDAHVTADSAPKVRNRKARHRCSGRGVGRNSTVWTTFQTARPSTLFRSR